MYCGQALFDKAHPNDNSRNSSSVKDTYDEVLRLSAEVARCRLNDSWCSELQQEQQQRRKLRCQIDIMPHGRFAWQWQALPSGHLMTNMVTIRVHMLLPSVQRAAALCELLYLDEQTQKFFQRKLNTHVPAAYYCLPPTLHTPIAYRDCMTDR
eukprot:GHUV01057423.1.p1 GENE.GHUV01057423.1~~GHUV01057423.1.p1  ORF type:complete len:153 (-),score=33.48 GHUV01057423.1:102-560(-)